MTSHDNRRLRLTLKNGKERRLVGVEFSSGLHDMEESSLDCIRSLSVILCTLHLPGQVLASAIIAQFQSLISRTCVHSMERDFIARGFARSQQANNKGRGTF